MVEEKFKTAKVKLTTLCNYKAIIQQALASKYISEEDYAILEDWHKDPAGWGNKI